MPLTFMHETQKPAITLELAFVYNEHGQNFFLACETAGAKKTACSHRLRYTVE